VTGRGGETMCAFHFDEIGAGADQLSGQLRQRCCGRASFAVAAEETGCAWG
jgi:hypothetical protein